MQEKRVRRDAEENRKTILKKANELFEKYGIEGVSMHQIAKSAGVGQGTLYRRYADKGDLCRDLKNERFCRFLDNLDADMTVMAKQPLRAKLLYLLQTTADFVEEQAAWLQFLQYRPPAGEDGRKSIYHSPHYQGLHEMLCRLLEEERQKLADKKINPVVLADSILTLVMPNLYLFLRHDRNMTKAEILELCQQLYFDTFLA